MNKKVFFCLSPLLYICVSPTCIVSFFCALLSSALAILAQLSELTEELYYIRYDCMDYLFALNYIRLVFDSICFTLPKSIQARRETH